MSADVGLACQLRALSYDGESITEFRDRLTSELESATRLGRDLVYHRLDGGAELACHPQLFAELLELLTPDGLFESLQLVIAAANAERARLQGEIHRGQALLRLPKLRRRLRAAERRDDRSAADAYRVLIKELESELLRG